MGQKKQNPTPNSMFINHARERERERERERGERERERERERDGQTSSLIF